MALDYGLPQGDFTMGGGSMEMPDAAMLGNILGDLKAKITVETEEIPDDYSGVPKKTKTGEEIDLAEMMGGPAPMMMDPNMAPAPPPMMGGMPQMQQNPMMGGVAQMQQPQQQMPGSMGVQVAQSVMQQPFG